MELCWWVCCQFETNGCLVTWRACYIYSYGVLFWSVSRKMMHHHALRNLDRHWGFTLNDPISFHTRQNVMNLMMTTSYTHTADETVDCMLFHVDTGRIPLVAQAIKRKKLQAIAIGKTITRGVGRKYHQLSWLLSWRCWVSIGRCYVYIYRTNINLKFH